MLNYLPDFDSEITVQTKMFSFREVDELGQLFREYDFDVTSDVPSADEVRNVLSGSETLPSKHAFFELDPDAAVDWSQDEELKRIYLQGNETESSDITVADFAVRILDVLDSGDAEVINRSLAIFKLEEDKQAEIILEDLTANIPDDMIDIVHKMLTSRMESRTKSRVQEVELNLFGTEEEIRTAVDDIVDNVDAAKDEDYQTAIEDAIAERLTELSGTLPTSKLVTIIDQFDQSPLVGINTRLDVFSLLDRIQHLENKLDKDQTIPYTVKMADVISRTLPDKLQESIEKRVDFATSVPSPILYAGIARLGNGLAVPDIYSIGYSQGSNRFNIYMNPDMKVIVESNDQSNFSLTFKYQMESGFVNFIIEANPVRNQVGAADGTDVLTGAQVKNQDALPKGNMVALIGVLKTLEVYGGKIKDLPSDDLPNIQKMKTADMIVVQPGGFENFDSKYLATFRSFWGRVQSAWVT